MPAGRRDAPRSGCRNVGGFRGGSGELPAAGRGPGAVLSLGPQQDPRLPELRLGCSLGSTALSWLLEEEAGPGGAGGTRPGWSPEGGNEGRVGTVGRPASLQRTGPCRGDRRRWKERDKECLPNILSFWFYGKMVKLFLASGDYRGWQ